MLCFLYLSNDICGIGKTQTAHFEVTSNPKQKIIFVGKKERLACPEKPDRTLSLFLCVRERRRPRPTALNVSVDSTPL